MLRKKKLSSEMNEMSMSVMKKKSRIIYKKKKTRAHSPLFAEEIDIGDSKQ